MHHDFLSNLSIISSKADHGYQVTPTLSYFKKVTGFFAACKDKKSADKAIVLMFHHTHLARWLSLDFEDDYGLLIKVAAILDVA